MGCFVLFLPSQDKFMEKLMCICYTIILQMTRLKCFELAPGVHSTTLGLAFKSSLCSSSLQPSSQKRKAQELQNWTEDKSLILKIQSNFYATSGQNYLTNFTPKVPYLPPFLCKNPLVPFSSVIVCKLTNNTPCGHHIWTGRMER